jgi:hypothetical protein
MALSGERVKQIRKEFESWLVTRLGEQEVLDHLSKFDQGYKTWWAREQWITWLAHAEQIEAELAALRAVAEAAKGWIKEQESMMNDKSIMAGPNHAEAINQSIDRLVEAVDALTALEGGKDAE